MKGRKGFAREGEMKGKKLWRDNKQCEERDMQDLEYLG